jgi:hypothetical protein
MSSSEQILVSSWPTAGVGASAVVGTLLSIASIFIIIALATQLKKAFKAVNLVMQLLNIPVSRELPLFQVVDDSMQLTEMVWQNILDTTDAIPC